MGAECQPHPQEGLSVVRIKGGDAHSLLRVQWTDPLEGGSAGGQSSIFVSGTTAIEGDRFRHTLLIGSAV